MNSGAWCWECRWYQDCPGFLFLVLLTCFGLVAKSLDPRDTVGERSPSKLLSRAPTGDGMGLDLWDCPFSGEGGSLLVSACGLLDCLKAAELAAEAAKAAFSDITAVKVQAGTPGDHGLRLVRVPFKRDRVGF